MYGVIRGNTATSGQFQAFLVKVQYSHSSFYADG